MILCLIFKEYFNNRDHTFWLVWPEVWNFLLIFLLIILIWRCPMQKRCRHQLSSCFIALAKRNSYAILQQLLFTSFSFFNNVLSLGLPKAAIWHNVFHLWCNVRTYFTFVARVQQMYLFYIKFTFTVTSAFLLAVITRVYLCKEVAHFVGYVPRSKPLTLCYSWT